MLEIIILDSLKRFDKRNFIFTAIFIIYFGYLLVTGDTFQYDSLTIWIQYVLVAAGDTCIVACMRKKFQFNMGVSLFFTGLLLTPHMITRLFVGPHLTQANALLFSLYLAAFVCLLDMVWSERPVSRKSFCILAFFMVLSLLQNQMTVLFVAWFLVAYVLVVKNAVAQTRRIQEQNNTFVLAENIGRQGLVAILAAVMIAFAARSVIIQVYHYCEQILPVDTASGNVVSSAYVLYVAGREI